VIKLQRKANCLEIDMSSQIYRWIRVELGPDGSLVYTDEKGELAHKKRSHKDALECFQWISDSGALEISFPEGHPFDQHPVRSEAGKPTPPVRVSARAVKRAYKYDVTLTDKQGKRHYEDPEVIIDEIDGDSGMDHPLQ
jgi:hypothetical protein